MASDEERVEAWRGGDQSAGDELLRKHYASVRRFFDLKVPHAAEDLTQATFLGLVEGKERISSPGGFRAYLFGIARRKLLMHLRDQSRFDRALAFREAQGPDTAVSPSGVVAMRQEQRLLLIAIQHLPHDLQIALQLFYWERMKNREIAEVLEIPMGTVGNRIARARELVREELARMRVSAAVQAAVNDDFDRWTRSLLAEPTAAPRGRR